MANDYLYLVCRVCCRSVQIAKHHGTTIEFVAIGEPNNERTPADAWVERHRKACFPSPEFDEESPLGLEAHSGADRPGVVWSEKHRCRLFLRLKVVDAEQWGGGVFDPDTDDYLCEEERT